VGDHFRYGRRSRGYDRESCSHGLDEHDAKSLLARGEAEHMRVVEGGTHVLVSLYSSAKADHVV
jgi:hypothetical protein